MGAPTEKPRRGPEEAWRTRWTDRSPCQMGLTGGCASGNHRACSHGPNGKIPHGVRMYETAVTMPKKNGGHWVHAIVAWVVEPHHVYRCPCECHGAGVPGQQMELFEGVM